MSSPAPSAKRRVRYFVSYTRADGDLPDKLLAELDKLFSACAEFEFQRWQDTHILPGEKWHAEIQKAIAACDFGLLLVSPAFLGNKYIREHELPQFVNADDKICIPVGLCQIDLENHDLKGLEASQIYLHVPPSGKHGKPFDHFTTAKTKTAYAYTLHKRIIERLKKSLDAKKSAVDAKTTAATTQLQKVTNNLPRLEHFFGRTKELEVIGRALLPQTRTWGVLIDGPGGMGKTSLAVRAAELAAPQFDRVLFITTKNQKLTPQGTVAVTTSIVPAYAEILSQMAGMLGLAHAAEKPEAERATLIKTALQSEKVLFILDNLENLEKPQQDLLYEFLMDLPPTCKALVTSRRRTDVEARLIRLEKLDQDAALELLKELEPGRPLLQKASHEERLHLYEETGGNPLLLRWIVGQLGRGSCRTLDAALELCRKATTSKDDPLEFIFGDLLETFTAAETQALAALTYFTQKIEVKFVAELASLSKTATQTALADLANRALVMPDEAEEKYALVPMVADFLRRKRPEVVAETGDRLEKRAYAEIMQNGWNEHKRFPVLEAAWPSVAAAIPIFLAGPNERLQEVFAALKSFLNFSGRWDEWLALSLQAEARAQAAGDHYNAGWRAYDIGWVHGLRKQADEVLPNANRATAHWAQAFPSDIAGLEGTRERAFATQLCGLGYRLKKDYSAALAAHRKVVELLRSLSNEGSDLATALNDLATAEIFSGDYEAAELNFCESLRLSLLADSSEGVTTSTGNLAALALNKEDWARAEALASEALTLAKTLGRKELIASNSNRLAHALERQKRGAEGLPHAWRAVEIYTQLDSPRLADAQEMQAACEAAAGGSGGA